MKELKRVSIRIVKRINKYLYNNPTKRTKAAMYCNMAYDKFMMYVVWMKKMGMMQVYYKDGEVFLKT